VTRRRTKEDYAKFFLNLIGLNTSQYSPREFTIGNIFKDGDITDKVKNYNFHNRFTLGNNPKCNSCELDTSCKKGCPAAVIASGQKITGNE